MNRRASQQSLGSVEASSEEHESSSRPVKLHLETIWKELDSAESLSPFGYIELFFRYVVSAVRKGMVGTLSTIFLTALAVFLSASVLLATKPFSELFFTDDHLIPIKVYVEPGASEVIGALLKSQKTVERVQLVNGKEALQRMKERLGEEHPLFQSVQSLALEEKGVNGEDGSPLLPDRYLVSVRSGVDKEAVFGELQQLLSGREEVRKISMQSELLQRVKRLAGLFENVGLLFALASFLGAMCLVIIAVQLRFLLRSREVGVMRLVGATREFIVIPLYLESLLVSVAAVVIAFIGLSWLEGALYSEVIAVYPNLQYREDVFSLSLLSKSVLAFAAVGITLVGTWCSVSFFQSNR